MDHPTSPLRRLRGPALAVLLTLACTDGPTGPPPDGAIDLSAPWVSITPSAAGVDAGELFVVSELAGRIERLRSVVVVKGGRLVFERYYGGATARTLADVRSITKSVVSTLVGIAEAEGLLDLDQPITDFLRRPRYAVREEHSSVTVRDLLMMTSGIQWSERGTVQYEDWVQSADPVDYVLARGFDATPGDAFTYNSAAVHLLAVLLEEATGASLPDYADRVLFEPLGIADRAWEVLGNGSVNGGSGLDLRPRDLARFGQLHLQAGFSGSRSIVPAAWIDEATAERISGLSPVGPIDRLSYGFLWWLDPERHAYLAWGFGGQFVYVAPDLDLVVVATTDWRGVSEDIGSERLQQEVLAIIVDRIVPAAR